MRIIEIDDMISKKPVCTEICAHPDLIMCEKQFGAPDDRGTKKEKVKQVKFIMECPRRKTHKCKFEKVIKSGEWD